ncbi:MAG: V-type ATP synthase subunit I [Candidatus Thorarchaeota archaeon]
MTKKTEMCLFKVGINKYDKDRLLNVLSSINNVQIKAREKLISGKKGEEKDTFFNIVKNLRQGLDSLFNKLNVNESNFQELKKVAQNQKVEFLVRDIPELVNKTLEEINFYTNRINELDKYIAKARIELENIQIIKSSYTFLEQYNLTRDSLSKFNNLNFKVFTTFKKNIENFKSLFEFDAFPNVHQTDELFPNAYRLEDRITFFIIYPRDREEDLRERINLIHAEEVPILKKYLTTEVINFSRINNEIDIINTTLSKYQKERDLLRDQNMIKFAALNEVVQNVEEYHWAEQQFEEFSKERLTLNFFLPLRRRRNVEQLLSDQFKNKIVIDIFDIPRFHEVKDLDRLEPKLKEKESLKNIPQKTDTNQLDQAEEQLKAKTPTIMRNPWFIRPFELITKMYGVPSYSEVDPTPFLAFTFPFIFGLMFGDIGHGLVLIIAGILGGILFRKKKTGQFSWIVFYCGIGAVLGGLFYGEFFGYEQIFGIPLQPIFITVPFLGPVSLFDPIANITVVFEFALFIGVVHINLGWFLELINYVRQSKKYLAFSNSFIKICLLTGGTYLIFTYGINLTVWLSSTSLLTFWGPITLPPPILLVIIPGILLILLKPLGKVFGISYLKKESYGALMGEGTMETFETALSVLSNVASYIRLLALALAHIALMISIQALSNLLQGEGIWFDILKFLGLILGNIIVILLEGILVFINTIRLHFYEFFFKFYKGTGTEFFPFYLDNDYSKIIFREHLEKDVISEEIEKEIEPEKAKKDIDEAISYIEQKYFKS